MGIKPSTTSDVRFHGSRIQGDSISHDGQRNRLAANLLAILIMVICLSPRLRIAAISPDVASADIRWQDILLPLIGGYLVLTWRHRDRSPVFRYFGIWLPVFLWWLGLEVSLHLLTNPHISMFRRLAYSGRVAEMFMLAACVAILYRRAGQHGPGAVLIAVHASAYANFAWVIFQILTGNYSTFFEAQTGRLLTSYGPKLIGEGSAFGTGQYFAFVAAFGLAEYKARLISVRFSTSLIGIGLIGALLSESRVSIGAIALLTALIWIRSESGKRLVNPANLVSGILVLGTTAIVFLYRAGGRFTTANIEGGLKTRIDVVWRPFTNLLLDNPIIGVGPGGLIEPLYPSSEAHNAFLRAGLDFGILGGIIFLGMFVTVMLGALRLSRTAKSKDQVAFSMLCSLTTFSILFSGLVQDSMTVVTSTHLTMLGIGLFAAVALDAHAPDHVRAAIRFPELHSRTRHRHASTVPRTTHADVHQQAPSLGDSWNR